MNKNKRNHTSNYILQKTLGKLNFDSALFWVLNKLAYVERVGVGNATEFVPWNLLLFLRYCSKYSTKKNFSEEQKILNAYAVYDEYINVREDKYLNNEKQDLNKFFLRLAHQQFPFQLGLIGLKHKTARQLIFFSHFDNFLLEKYGLNSITFLKVSFLLFSVFSKNTRVINASSFSQVRKFSNSEDMITKYLEIVAIDPKELQRQLWLTVQFNDDDIYDNFIFKRKPLLKYQDKFYLFSNAFFYQVLAYGLYDLIKPYSEARMQFGTLFEEYAQKRIDQHFPDNLSERAMRDRTQKTRDEPSKVDTVVNSPANIILFEYKATELTEEAIIDPSNEKIGALRGLIKGVAQGYKTIRLFKSSENNFPEIDLSKPRFLLIVSYRETYLGNAERHWGIIAPILQKQYNIDNLEDIDSSNIFLISIDDLEWLLSLKDQIDEVLHSAVNRFKMNDAFDFSQILSKFVDKKFKNPHLDSAFEKMIQQCLADIRLDPSKIVITT